MQVSSTVGWAKDASTLSTLMEQGKKIIITIVHKFQFILDAVSADYKNKKFAIIIDEAHSSQNGSLAAKMNIAVSGNVYDDDDEFEDKLNTIIEGKKMAPNASYFAFTATPKNKTLEMFGKKMFDEHGNPILNDDGTQKANPHYVYTMKQAMRDICTLNGIEPLVERSRSGKGAHIWIFFDKPISAAVVRKFGLALLDKGAEQVNLKSFNYYDRMLPAQDSLENVAIGNLIALPLQGRALKDGNSAFVDGNWNAYPDQWNALLSKPKLSEEFLENKIREWTFTADDLEASSDEENREKPWDRMKNFAKSDVDGKMDITLSNGIYVDSTNLKPAMQNKIRRMAAFSNPVFYKNRAIGTSNYDTSRWIYLGKDHLGGYIQIPRGLQDELIANIDKAGIEYTIDDERQQGRNINVEFNGELRPET